jgi:hypothetical protein
MGSARFVAERIRDKSDYNTETEYVGETKSILEEDERHTIRVIVTERSDEY